jgi:hypothetical protein
VATGLLVALPVGLQSPGAVAPANVGILGGVVAGGAAR